MLVLFLRSFSIVLLSVVSLNAQSNHLRAGQQPPPIVFSAYPAGTPVTLSASDLRGTVYLIDFWATWCAPCIGSIPHMDSLVAAFRGRSVRFISITYEPKELVEKFLKNHPMKTEIGLDKNFAMFRRYNAWAIPNIVMINATGEIAGRVHPSRLNEAVIEELIAGKIPALENTREDLFDAKQAEEYFQSLIKEEK
jgi:thiol-disulfide isomerase/thioredoxin